MIWDCDVVSQFLFSLNNCGVLIQFVVVVFQLAVDVYLGLLWPFIQLFLALVYTNFWGFCLIYLLMIVGFLVRCVFMYRWIRVHALFSMTKGLSCIRNCLLDYFISGLKVVCLVSVFDCHECLLFCDWVLLFSCRVVPSCHLSHISLAARFSLPPLPLHLPLTVVSVQYHSVVVQVVECPFADCWLVCELLSFYLFKKNFRLTQWSLSCPTLHFLHLYDGCSTGSAHNNNFSRKFGENVHQPVEHEESDQIEE